MTTGISLLTSSTSATATMSLSATGSGNAPSRDVCPMRRANRPIQRIGDAGQREQQAGGRVRPLEGWIEQDDDQRDREDPQPGQRVWQVQIILGH